MLHESQFSKIQRERVKMYDLETEVEVILSISDNPNDLDECSKSYRHGFWGY